MRLADPPRYEVIYDTITPWIQVGARLGEVDVLPPDKLARLAGFLTDAPQPVEYHGIGVYPDDDLHPKVHVFAAPDGSVIPVALPHGDLLHNPAVSHLVMARNPDHVQYPFLFGLNGDLVVIGIAPLIPVDGWSLADYLGEVAA
jgi:hypothetical protein